MEGTEEQDGRLTQKKKKINAHKPKIICNFVSYPLGLPRHFVVQPATAIADLVIDALDCPSVLKDRVSLCQRYDAYSATTKI